jgi:hypothetical protein
MQNGEVREIVRLEGQAAQTEKASSADRWHAAQLIFNQLRTKTFRRLSSDIQEAGGKGSVSHLERMKKCWELIGQLQYETFKDDFSSYPDFTTIYQSDEVRDSEKKQQEKEEKERRRKEGHDPEDFSAHGLAVTASNAVDSLSRNPAIRDSLSEDDIALLREAYDKLRVIIRGFGR